MHTVLKSIVFVLEALWSSKNEQQRNVEKTSAVSNKNVCGCICGFCMQLHEIIWQDRVILLGKTKTNKYSFKPF